MSLQSFILQESLRPELQPHEDVLWSGQPDPDVLFTKADRFLIPFSLLWGGFSLFWEGLVIYSLLRGDTRSGNGGDLRFFVVFGLIFVAIGLYLMFGRFIYKRLRKKRTLYAVTNKHLLALTHLRRRRVETTPIEQVLSIERTANADGTGTLIFKETEPPARVIDRVRSLFTPRQEDYGNTGLELLGYGKTAWDLAFYDIPDADHVYDLVNELRQKPASQQPAP